MSNLAIDGGKPIRNAPLPPWPYYEEDEIDAVISILKSGKVNYWTGDECRHFEREFAKGIGRKYAIALANGTLALEAALQSLGIGPGDDVVVASRTFIASASCIVMRGANPIIADVECESQNINAETIADVITKNTKAVIVVHFAGWPCDMDPILDLAKEREIYVVEDCAQAQGATYKGRPVGCMGDVATFSFCQDKIMSTGGEGGMLVLDDESIWRKAWSFKDHGKSYDAVYNRNHPFGFKWLHESFGTNWRMTEMQAAIGRIQQCKMPLWLRVRRDHAGYLSRALSRIKGLKVFIPPPHVDHAYYKFYAFVSPAELHDGWSRDRIAQAIEAEGVPCGVGSCSEIYLEKAFKGTVGCPEERLPVARMIGESSLMFMVHPTLTNEDIGDTCEAIDKVMRIAAK